MKISDWLRGAANVFLADVDGVFGAAKAAVAAAPFVPANLRTDTIQLLNDAQADLHGLEGLAAGAAGSLAADAVDDLTTLVANTGQNLAAGRKLSEMSAAEKAIFQQTWTAMRAQGDTLIAQVLAGIDPTAQPPKLDPVKTGDLGQG